MGFAVNTKPGNDKEESSKKKFPPSGRPAAQGN